MNEWANNPGATTGLTYGYYGGTALSGVSTVLIANGTISLANNATNYVQRTYDGTVTVNQTAFGATLIPLAKVTTSGGAITTIEDWRPLHGPFPYFPVLADETSLGMTVTDVRYPYSCANRYGAFGDYVDDAHPGTDNTTAIQAAIDYSIYGSGKRHVTILGGRYRTTATLQAGYGTAGNYDSVVIEGVGYRYRGEAVFSGTSLHPSQTDSPCINFQGGRGSVLRGMAIIGKLGSYITAHHLAGDGGTPDLDDTVSSNWTDTSLGSNTDSRYAPYAGIAVDAYSGTRPGTSYPDVTYPSFLGATSQYGKLTSQDVLIEDVFIEGFIVGVANQPSDTDSNGDFTNLNRVYVSRCKWGVSVGNSQSRNFGLSNVKGSYLYAMLTNDKHGKQLGKFGGAITNLSLYGGVINIFEFRNFYAEPIHFVNFYGESLWRIGTIATGTTNTRSVIFTAGEFSFGAQNDTRGYPANVLSDAAYGGLDMQFRGCYFINYNSVASFYMRGVTFDGSYFRRDDARTNTYEQIAHNALVGGLVTFQLETPDRSRLKLDPYNLDSGSKLGAPYSTRRWMRSTRLHCIPFYCEQVSSYQEAWDVLGGSGGGPPRLADRVVSKTSLSTCSLSGRTLTVTFASRSNTLFMQCGPEVGDVLWDDETGTTFFVRSRTGTTILAEMQNNYKSAGGGTWTTVTTFSTNSGNLWFRNARYYTPQYYLRGDATAGSAVLTNCARDDGYTGFITGDIATGDALAVLDTMDQWVSSTQAVITGVTAGTDHDYGIDRDADPGEAALRLVYQAASCQCLG